MLRMLHKRRQTAVLHQLWAASVQKSAQRASPRTAASAPACLPACLQALCEGNPFIAELPASSLFSFLLFKVVTGNGSGQEAEGNVPLG